MMRWGMLSWVAVLAATCSGLEVPSKSPTGDMVRIVHESKSFIKIVPERSASQRIELSDTETLFTGLPGEYRIQEVYQGEGGWVENNATCVVGDQGPVPPDPLPDPPGPDPDPPGPGPTPTTKPVVVIVHETADEVPRSLTSMTVRTWLNSHCLTVDETPGWRQWDDDYRTQDLVHESPKLVSLYVRAKAEAKGKVPWIAIDDGRAVTSQALPLSETDLLKLLKAKGGE